MVGLDSCLGLEHADILNRNLSALEVIVVLEGHIARGEVVVGGTVALLEVGELLTHGHLALHHAAEVPSGEQAVVRNAMVHSMRLVVMKVLEVRGIRVTKIEWHIGVTIIDSIKVTALHELLNIVLDDRGLVDSSSLGSSSVDTDAITESEDVLEALVLKSVGVHINYTLAVSDLGVSELLVRLAGRVNHSSEEVLLNDLA
jgi:hypothetical protein